jgi:hypothetical protein
VDVYGCASSQLDSDQDGVTDDRDYCPNTPRGQKVDAYGCVPSQRDSDQDGVTDDRDRCPNTPIGQKVDTYGCPAAALPQKITFVIEGPDEAKEGESVTYRAKINDAAALASLNSMGAGAWGYYWYINGRALQTTSETVRFETPERGANIIAKLVRATGPGKAEELAQAGKTLKAKPKSPPTQGSGPGSAQTVSLWAGTYKTKEGNSTLVIDVRGGSMTAKNTFIGNLNNPAEQFDGNTLTNCRVNGNVARCEALDGHYHDKDKDMRYQSDVDLVLNGSELTGTTTIKGTVQEQWHGGQKLYDVRKAGTVFGPSRFIRQ